MRIRVKDGEHDLNLVLPTSLLFGKAVVKLVNSLGRKYASDALKDIPPEALEAICAELRRVKKKHGTWELVDVESADGQIVKIIL